MSRNWIATILAPEATSTQVRVLFLGALDAEGLPTEIIERLATLDETVPELDGDELPLLLAISDNDTEMNSRDTKKFFAACSIAQHHSRPSTPTDQAWIETLWGHVNHENPHLMTITDPFVLAAELERIRATTTPSACTRASGTSLPTTNTKAEATPSIRAARQAGLERADQQRRAWHRAQRAAR